MAILLFLSVEFDGRKRRRVLRELELVWNVAIFCAVFTDLKQVKGFGVFDDESNGFVR